MCVPPPSHSLLSVVPAARIGVGFVPEVTHTHGHTMRARRRWRPPSMRPIAFPSAHTQFGWFLFFLDWASHGVSWFSCVFSASQEKKADKIHFSTASVISGDFDQLYRFCERELVHFLSVLRLQRIMEEIEYVRTGSTVARVNDNNFPPELPLLMAELHYPHLSTLDPLLTFLIECHSILRSTYIYFAIHFRRLDPSFADPTLAARSLQFDLNQFEYFVNSLDHTLIPDPQVRRSIRTHAMMQDTAAAVRKYASKFAETIKLFQQTDLAHEDEKEVTEAFFAAVDKATSAI